MSDISLFLPVGASFIAIVSFVMVFLAFREQSWQIRRWLFLGTGFWIPWAVFTVLMRLAPSEVVAIWYLRASFISLQILSYSLYRFHHLLVFKQTDTRFPSFFMAVLVGFNITMGLNEQMLGTHLTMDGRFYTDEFSVILLMTNLLLNGLAGYWTLLALRKLNLFSTFYDLEGKPKRFAIIFSVIVISMLLVLLVIWLIQGTIGQNPDSSLFILLSWFVIAFLGVTYGIDPLTTFLAPQRVYQFFIINRGGVPLYYYTFDKRTQGDIGEVIILTGVLHATNAVLKMELGSESSMNLVSMEDKTIMIQNYKELLFCLVTEYNSPQFETVLNEYVKRITNSDEFLKINNFDRPNNLNLDFIDPIILDILSTKKRGGKR